MGEAEDRPFGELFAAAKKAGMSVIDYNPPGGETHEELIARAKLFFTNLIKWVWLTSRVHQPTRGGKRACKPIQPIQMEKIDLQFPYKVNN